MAKRRPSGDGMVRKRDDGRWEGRIVVGHKENGDSIFHYVSAKTQKALMEKMHRCIVEYDGAELTGDSRMTLGEWLDIDRGIAKAEISRQKAEAASEAQRFEPYTPPRRRPGTGYIKQLKEDLWDGRYSPVWTDGKKHSRDVYGRTREECEEKLAKLILQMKAEIAVLRNGTATEYPDGVSPKKKQLAEYLRQHPSVSNKSYIARETGMDRTTVQKYYDEVRAELATPANT